MIKTAKERLGPASPQWMTDKARVHLVASAHLLRAPEEMLREKEAEIGAWVEAAIELEHAGAAPRKPSADLSSAFAHPLAALALTEAKDAFSGIVPMVASLQAERGAIAKASELLAFSAAGGEGRALLARRAIEGMGFSLGQTGALLDHAFVGACLKAIGPDAAGSGQMYFGALLTAFHHGGLVPPSPSAALEVAVGAIGSLAMHEMFGSVRSGAQGHDESKRKYAPLNQERLGFSGWCQNQLMAALSHWPEDNAAPIDPALASMASKMIQLVRQGDDLHLSALINGRALDRLEAMVERVILSEQSTPLGPGGAAAKLASRRERPPQPGDEPRLKPNQGG